jgi:hypothetical protein
VIHEDYVKVAIAHWHSYDAFYGSEELNIMDLFEILGS